MSCKLKVDEKLMEGFDGQVFACVRDICYDIDDDVYIKYSKICYQLGESDKNLFITNNQEKNEIIHDCKECWVKFMTEDLIIKTEEK